MASIADNLLTVCQRIGAACVAAGRAPSSVRLLAVSKTYGAQEVLAAHSAGQCAFGENYIQEGIEKITALSPQVFTPPLFPALDWHCIGPIQSNKTKGVAQHFDWVQSLDRLKIAQRLNEQRPPHLPPLQVCIQVNVDGGANKSGVEPQHALELALALQELPALKLRGLMCIPEPADFAQTLEVMGQAKVLFDQLNAYSHNGKSLGLDTLSMGMTADLEAAIQAGSTMVRVGTAIFGKR
ncbi:MAG: YggS family pyridoxal phosphate-dependent enzyme [Betaproteobacteria bacterium]|nr:YggS family pyridoxal phosphate-dependent enzyme [Betaproteobacteria bacterium]